MNTKAVKRAAVLLSVLLPLAAAGAEEVVLQNDHVRLVVARSNGSIVQLTHRPSETEYLGERAQARLFRLLIPTMEDLSRRIESTDQAPASINVSGDTLTIEFRDLQIHRRMRMHAGAAFELPLQKLPISVTATFRLSGEHVLANLVVDNRSLEDITDVTFPWISGLSTEGDGEARIVLPSLGEKVFTNTALRSRRAERAQRYPALLAAKWLHYEVGGKGFGIDVRSSTETQDALFLLVPGGPRRPSAAHLGWIFYPHIAGQSRWTSPDVVIHVHHSDWRAVAGEHREWYRGNHGIEAYPGLRGEIGFATYRLKRHEDSVNWKYAELPALAEQARAAGMRRVVIQGWRERETPANPSPFGEVADPRLGGRDGLKAAIDAVRRDGSELIFAFHPTVLNTAPQRAQLWKFRWAVKTRRQGHQYIPAHTFMTPDYPFQDHLRHYWTPIDPGTGATDHLLGEARRLKKEYGIRNLFLRGVGTQSFLSYNQENATLPQKAYQKGYERFLGGLRKLTPDGILMMEGFNDLVNAYSSAGYTWSQAENAEVLALSIPWVPFSTDVEALEYEKANAAFARQVLINLVVDGGDASVTAYPEFARHLQALQRLKESARPCLANSEFREHEGLREVVSSPDLLVSAFVNDAGRPTGLILANGAAEAQQAGFQFAGTAPVTGRLVRLNGREEAVDVSQPVRVQLEPREVAVLCLAPAKSKQLPN